MQIADQGNVDLSSPKMWIRDMKKNTANETLNKVSTRHASEKHFKGNLGRESLKCTNSFKIK